MISLSHIGIIIIKQILNLFQVLTRNFKHVARLSILNGSPTEHNHIGGVMVNVLLSSAGDRGFEPRSGHTNDYKIGICCFSAKHAALRRKSKD